MVEHDVYFCDDDYVEVELYAEHGEGHDAVLAGVLLLVSQVWVTVKHPL